MVDTTEETTTRLMDKVGVMSLDATEYPQEEHVTTVDLDYLKSAVTIFDELGWDTVDIRAVPDGKGAADYPLLVLRPPHDSIFGGQNAGVSIAPLSEQGRERRADDGEE